MPEQDRATVAGADFEELLREVLARVNGALDEQARLRLLLDAVVSMAADLTLDGVLPASSRSRGTSRAPSTPRWGC